MCITEQMESERTPYAAWRKEITTSHVLLDDPFSWLGRKNKATYVEKKYTPKTSLAVVGLARCSVSFSCTRRLKRAVKGHANTNVRRKSATFPSRFPLFYRELRPLSRITLFFTLKIKITHTR